MVWLAITPVSCGVQGLEADSSSSSSGSSDATLPDEPIRCDSSYPCASDLEVCYRGECVPLGPCDDPHDCTDPMVCVHERCVEPGPCDDAIDCAGGQMCDDGQCAAAPEVPTCETSILTQSLFVIDHGDGAPSSVVFRNADGDAAHELAIGVDASIVQVRGGGTEAIPLLETDGTARVLRAADLDLDGLDELAIADATLRVHNPASGGVVVWNTYTSSTVPDFAIGLTTVGSHNVAAALWYCPFYEGCASEVELAHLQVTEGGGLDFSANQAIREPMLGIAMGHLGAQPNAIVIDIAEGFRTFRLGTGYPPADDPAVRGVGVLAIGDLDASGFDEIVRLSPGESATVASIYASTGETLVPQRRAGFAGELRLVRIGDLDGDAWADVVLAWDSQLVLWFDASVDAPEGCAVVIPAPHAVVAIALGDADGDGRDEVAIAGGHSTTVLRVE